MALATHRENVPADVIYRFAGVEVDAVGRRLYVDSQERACSHRVFNLLLMLCEQPGRVYTRDELFVQLWPSGRFPADESLSQLIFRLRTALGPYHGVLVTVRHVGLRLDAEVRREIHALPIVDARAPEAPPSIGDAGSEASSAEAAGDAWLAANAARVVQPRPRPRHRWYLAVAALVTMILATILVLWPHESVVDAGWGLYESDLMATRSDTADTLREAFRLEAEGDRSKARLLLETVDQADSTTPVPAMFLGLWSNLTGATQDGDVWFAKAERRLHSGAPHYTRLLGRFLRHGTNTSPKVESLLLDLKPSAWQLRLARAHAYLFRNQRAEALSDLRRLPPITRFNNRNLAVALSDRASLGDPDGAEAILNAIDPEPDNALFPYTRGRIHAARGQFVAARASFDEAAAIATRTDQPVLRHMSERYAAVASAELGEWIDAADRLRRLRFLAWDEGRTDYVIETSLLLIALPALKAHERAREIEALSMNATSPNPYECVSIELTLGLLRVATPEGLRCRLDDMPDDYGHRGQQPLISGYRALTAGDPVAARTELERARAAGVGDTTLAGFADALAATLGETVAMPPRPDPPYPYWTRFAVRWQLQDASANSPSLQ